MPAAEKVCLIDLPRSQRHCHWLNDSASDQRRPRANGARRALLVPSFRCSPTLNKMKQGSGASHRAPPRARNRTRFVKTAAELSACLNIKNRYGDVTLKNFENVIVFYRILTYFIVFDHIWIVLIDRERSRKCQRTIKIDHERSRKVKKKDESIKNDQ